MAFLKLTLVTFGLLYAAVLAALYAFQRDLLYFPARHDPPPAAMGLQGVERVVLTTPDGERLILWLNEGLAGKPMILFLHGNAGAMADRADRLAFYQARGFGAAFLSWRGYGGSSGRPHEAGLMTDARTAYDALRQRGIPADRIVLVGESLGTGVAVQIAARVPVGAVVLEAPFTAAVDIAAGAYPWVPVRLLMQDQFRSRDHIAAVRAPLLILHGEADSVVPAAQGRALYALANAPKRFQSLGPVGHEALFSPATWAKGADFIEASLPAPEVTP